MNKDVALTTMSISIALVEPEDEILDNGEEEEEFLAAIEKGDINTFMEMLMKKEEIWLNLECKDANGKSALQVAIAQGYAVIVEQLLLHGVNVGDALLRAVDVALADTVKKICEFAEKLSTKEERQAILDCHCENDDFHPDISPIVLAAQRNDFTILKILLDYGTRIPDIGTKQIDSTTTTDSLLKSVGTLEVYKAVASGAYLSLGFPDPVDKSFELSETLTKLSRYFTDVPRGAESNKIPKTDVEFKAVYLELAENVDEIGRDIISQARNTEEIMTILTHHDRKKGTDADQPNHNLGPLPKLYKAIAFDQKQFVAHPNCQQAILSKFYGRLAYLRDRSPTFRRLLFLVIVLTFPFVSLAYLYVPTAWVKNNIGCPYTKFMLQMASDLVFVLLLSADTFMNEGVSTYFTLHRPTKVLLLMWIIGIAWREIKAFHRRGYTIFSQAKHVRDSGLAFLFIVGIVFDVADFHNILEANNGNVNGTLSEPDINDTNNDANVTPAFNLEYSESDRVRRAVLEDFVPLHNIGVRSSNHTRGAFQSFDITRNSSTGAIYMHRIPDIPIARAARGGKPGQVKFDVIAGGGDSLDSKITDPTFLRFMAQGWWHPRLLATAFFAMSTVISFLRMLPYVVVSDVIGPLQISLGSMITGTLHFFLVVFVVVFSFSVGLTYIYAYYDEVEWQQCVSRGDENTCSKGTLRNLFFGTLFLYWSVFGLETNEPLALANQAWVLNAAGTTLYAMFYVLVVVVLLNALIAVMSNVYNEVEENGDMEWKFASTALWMDVLLDDDVVPPPFNLFPSIETIENVFQRFYKQCRHLRTKTVVDHNGCKYTGPTKMNKRNGKNGKPKKKHENSHYQRVMSRLVERYVAAKTAGEVSVEADVSTADIRALRNDLVSLKFEMFQKLYDTNEDITRTIVDGLVIRDNSQDAKDAVYYKTEAVHAKFQSHLDYLLKYKTTLKNDIAAIPPERTPTPPPPPPEMKDNSVQTDPPPPPRAPTPPPPPPETENYATQTTPPPTPPPDPVLLDIFTQVTPPPTPPAMIDEETEIDAGLIPQDVGTMVKRFERKRAISLVPPNSFRPPIVEHKDPWRPFGHSQTSSRPTSPETTRKNLNRAFNILRSPRLSPDVPKSIGHGRLTPNRSPAISPETTRKVIGSRSSSISSGSLSPADSVSSSVGSINRLRSPGQSPISDSKKKVLPRKTEQVDGATPKKTTKAPVRSSNQIKKTRPAPPSRKPKSPKPSGRP